MKVFFASGNAGKFAEFQELLAGSAIALEPAQCPVEVEETGQTFLENARLKALAYARELGDACLADDSGLVVGALGGRPGVQSARYAQGDEAKIAKLLDELAGQTDRSASFHCALCLAWPNGSTVCTSGQTLGEIALKPSGQGGFGYDPVFFVPELGVTYAQMPPDQKNRYSHRGRAISALLRALAQTAQVK